MLALCHRHLHRERRDLAACPRGETSAPHVQARDKPCPDACAYMGSTASIICRVNSWQPTKDTEGCCRSRRNTTARRFIQKRHLGEIDDETTTCPGMNQPVHCCSSYCAPSRVSDPCYPQEHAIRLGLIGS